MRSFPNSICRFYWILYLVFFVLLPINAPLEYWDDSIQAALFVAFSLRYLIVLNISWLITSAHFIWGLDKKHKPSDSNMIFLVTKSYWPQYHYLLPFDYQTGEFGNYGKSFIWSIAVYFIVSTHTYALAHIHTLSFSLCLPFQFLSIFRSFFVGGSGALSLPLSFSQIHSFSYSLQGLLHSHFTSDDADSFTIHSSTTNTLPATPTTPLLPLHAYFSSGRAPFCPSFPLISILQSC